MAKARDQAVGKRIREGLAKRGLRASELSSILGRKPALVSHWLTGRRACPPAVLTEVASLLKVNRSWLAGEEEALHGARVMEVEKMASRRVQNSMGWWFR